MSPTWSIPPHRNPDSAPVWIDSPQALADLARRLCYEPVIAMDTESNSLHAYSEKVCLIQFSVPGADYLVDPLALPDLSPLATILADPTREKVFHAAEYDVMVLKRDYQFEFAHLFDTMIASRLLGWPRCGLGNILDERFGVLQDKRMQRRDWAQRPLSADEMEYARLDTHFLLPLRQILLTDLEQAGLLAEAREMFQEVTTAVWQGGDFDPDGFWRIRGARELDPTGLAVLRALYFFRDREARRRDRPPFKVIADATLLQLAMDRPKNWREMENIRGMTPYLLRRYGKCLHQVIDTGSRDDPPSPPQNHHHWPERPVIERYERLRAWRNAHAARHGVEPDVIVSNAVLMALARHRPQKLQEIQELGLMGPVKCAKYGGALLKVMWQG
ncbi:MAG: ribonuclease D [Chloroflexota bacterium]